VLAGVPPERAVRVDLPVNVKDDHCALLYVGVAGKGLGTDHNPQGNHQSFIELTRYKLEMLRASVLDSQVALSNQSYAKLKGAVDAAIAAHERGRFARALEKVTEFLSLVATTKYATLPGENFSGAHIMRASNIKFMYAQKVIPFEQ
jgi:hypothetical protein